MADRTSAVSPPHQHSSTFETPDDVHATNPISPVSPQIKSQQFPNLGTVDQNQSAPAQTAPHIDYSTLEIATDHSTVKYVDPSTQDHYATDKNNSYYGHGRGPSDSPDSYIPGHIRRPSGSSLPPYTQNGNRFSTLPETYHAPKEEYPATFKIKEEEEASRNEKPVVGGIWKRHVWGMSMKIALILLVILLLVIIGAVIGGVLGSRKSSDKTSAPDPSATNDAAAAGSSAASSASSTSTGPPRPSSTGSGGFLSDEYNLFTSARWYKVRLVSENESSTDPYDRANVRSLVMEASYDKATLSGVVNLKSAETARKSTAQNWQIRPVPGDWANSTVKIDPNGSEKNRQNLRRVYWIASRKYGPDVVLALGDVSQPWTDRSGIRGADPELEFLPVILKPRDVGDIGQYWYFYTTPVIDEYGQASTYKHNMYNVQTNYTYSLWYSTGWTNPKMGASLTVEDIGNSFFDSWDLISGDVVDEEEGGFPWFTDRSLEKKRPGVAK